MEIVKKNQEIADREKQEKIAKVEKDQRRSTFFERMRSNRQFQEFVVKEIIQDRIDNLQKTTSTFKNIDTLISATPEEVKNVMITKSASILILEDIKKRMS